MKPAVESITSPPLQSFSCLSLDLPAFHNTYHRHPEVELTLIQEGSGQRLIGDSLSPFHPGDLVLIGSDLPHQYQSEGADRARAKVIQFSADRFGSEFFQMSEFRPIGAMLQRAARGLDFTSSDAGVISRDIEGLFQLPAGSARAIRLIEILSGLSEKTPSQLASVEFSQQISTKSVARLDRTIRYIEEMTEQGHPIHLQQVADVAALHPQSVSRFFHQHVGMSFQRYLQTVRIGKATRRLLETDDPISMIAIDVGYISQSNFNRQFQEIHQTTPRDFRKALAKS